MSEAKDLFVLDPTLHTYFRWMALIGGIFLVVRGREYNDKLVEFIGWSTIAVDSWTFIESIKALSKDENELEF